MLVLRVQTIITGIANMTRYSVNREYEIDGKKIIYRTYKERFGFGVWKTIEEYSCPHCNKLIRSVINWHGQRSNGGFYCPHCSKVVSI